MLCVITGDSVAANKYHNTLSELACCSPSYFPSCVVAAVGSEPERPKYATPATKNKENLAQVPGIRRSVIIFSENSGRAHRVEYLSVM